MPKRDVFAELSVDEIKALGSDCVPELLAVVEARADAHDTSFGKIARKLPDGWRQILMAAHAVEAIEDTDCFAGAFYDIRRTKDVVALETFFKEIGATEMARQLQYAREQTNVLVDEDMDPLEIEELRDIRPDDLALGSVRAAITKRASSMAKPFPPAD